MDPAQMAAAGLSQEDANKMVGMIEEMQMRDSLKMYNRLVERCFSECVNSFRRKNLETDEERCTSKCTEKFLKHSARVTVRFQELSEQSGQAFLEQAQAMQAGANAK